MEPVNSQYCVLTHSATAAQSNRWAAALVILELFYGGMPSCIKGLWVNAPIAPILLLPMIWHKESLSQLTAWIRMVSPSLR